MSEPGTDDTVAAALWDDEAFRNRVAEVSLLRGMTARQAVIRAGTSPKFLDAAKGGRNLSIVIKVARFLGVHPAYLMFGPTIATGPDMSGVGGAFSFNDMPVDTVVSATTSERLSIIATLLATHLLGSRLDIVTAPLEADIKLRQIAAATGLCRAPQGEFRHRAAEKRAAD